MTEVWNPITFVPIIEGHGDDKALDALIRKIAHGKVSRPIQCAKPFRVKSERFLQMKADGDFGKYVRQAALQARSKKGTVFILLDSEGECPVILAEKVRSEAKALASDVPLSVVFADRMYENWFVASADTISRHEMFEAPWTAPEDPDGCSGKGYLKRRMIPKRSYRPEVDQLELTRLLNLELASKSRSFRKCRKEVETRLVHIPGAML